MSNRTGTCAWCGAEPVTGLESHGDVYCTVSCLRAAFLPDSDDVLEESKNETLPGSPGGYRTSSVHRAQRDVSPSRQWTRRRRAKPR